MRITHKDAIEDLVNKGKDLEKIVLSYIVMIYMDMAVGRVLWEHGYFMVSH